MATTKIADLYNPLVFDRVMPEETTRLNRFINSGIMVTNNDLQAMVSVGGDTGEITQYKPIDMSVEPDHSTDDLSIDATPQKVTSQKMNYRLYNGSKSWEFANLANQINLQKGGDPASVVTSSVAQYWSSVQEERVIRSCLGVLADNVANDSGDMVIDVATDDAGAVTDAERINSDVILEAQDTFGDAMSTNMIVAIHSKQYTRLRKQNLIDFIPDARGEVNIPTYMGMRVIVDDSLPAVAGTNRITYTGVMFGAGAFAYARGRVDVPSEVERSALAGNGAGGNTFTTRESMLIHPLGFTFNDDTLTSTGGYSQASYANLEVAANWTRVWDRKNIPLAFFQVND